MVLKKVNIFFAKVDIFYAKVDIFYAKVNNFLTKVDGRKVDIDFTLDLAYLNANLYFRASPQKILQIFYVNR